MTSEMMETAFQGWLNDLPSSLSRKLLDLGECLSLEAETIIYHIGDPTNSLWCIRAGLVRMNIATNEYEHRFGHLIGPGFWFGEYELLTGQPRLIEMKTATRCDLLRFSSRRIEELATKEPQLWRWIAVLSAQHTLLALSAADDLMLRNAVQRCAALLLRLSDNRAAHPASLPRDLVPVTQPELSEALNMSRSSAGAILRKMETEGAIRLDYRAIKIMDVGILAAYLAEC